MLPGNYPSPSNVKIYIGDIYIDDAFRVDWQAQNPKTPMYSWSDSEFKAVAQGREIVTGRLLINYRFPGYLASAIKRSAQLGPSDPKRQRSRVRENVEQLATGTTDERIQALMDANSKDDNGLDLGMIQAALKSINTPTVLNPGKHKKAPYRAGAVTPFDIKIIYGDAEGYHLTKMLQDCHITGESQTISGAATGGGDMSSSGSPIYEVYSFFCRNVEESFNNPTVD